MRKWAMRQAKQPSTSSSWMCLPVFHCINATTQGILIQATGTGCQIRFASSQTYPVPSSGIGVGGCQSKFPSNDHDGNGCGLMNTSAIGSYVQPDTCVLFRKVPLYEVCFQFQPRPSVCAINARPTGSVSGYASSGSPQVSLAENDYLQDRVGVVKFCEVCH
jgi:hypothetical protein